MKKAEVKDPKSDIKSTYEYLNICGFTKTLKQQTKIKDMMEL